MAQDQRPISIVEIYGSLAVIPEGGSPADAVPNFNEIVRQNGLFLRDEAFVVYTTSRMDIRKEDIVAQLDKWGCMYHKIQVARRGHSSASTFNIETPYGHSFGFDAHTHVHMFYRTESRQHSYLGPRQHTYKANHMYILQGSFIYGYVDQNSGEVYLETVHPGSIVYTPPGTQYSVELAAESASGSILVRSTHSESEDNTTL